MTDGRGGAPDRSCRPCLADVLDRTSSHAAATTAGRRISFASGDRYFLYYSAPGTQPKSAIGLLIGKTLDPGSPDYKWEDGGPIVWSDGVEDSNAIDPGVLRDPTNGTLWLTYGSYFGYIRLVELDPKTGKRLHPERKPVNIAINSEASIMIFRDGWYYLLVTHGSCCAGGNSSYNIRMGRSKKVTGPFVDNMGVDMIQGGGKLFAGSSGRHIGPGHFGLIDLGDGCRSSPATTSRTSIAAAPACSTSVRSSGAMAGRSRATTSPPAPTKSSPRGRARRSKWPCRVCRLAAARGRGGRGGGGDARAASPPPRPCAGRRTGQRELAGRPCQRAHGPLHGPGATEVDVHAGWRMPAAIPARRFSRSRLPAPTARSRPPGTRSWWSCPPSPAGRNNCGASISSPTAPIA